jgi:hypothetical protein
MGNEYLKLRLEMSASNDSPPGFQSAPKDKISGVVESAASE